MIMLTNALMWFLLGQSRDIKQFSFIVPILFLKYNAKLCLIIFFGISCIIRSRCLLSRIFLELEKMKSSGLLVRNTCNSNELRFFIYARSWMITRICFSFSHWTIASNTIMSLNFLSGVCFISQNAAKSAF